MVFSFSRTDVKGWDLTGQHDDDYNTTQFIIMMVETTQYILPFKGERACRRRHCTHLFLNADDVKGFPFELQFANISPAKNNDIMTKKNLHDKRNSTWQMKKMTPFFRVQLKVVQIIFYLAKLCYYP